jgi:hypothetical protein
MQSCRANGGQQALMQQVFKLLACIRTVEAQSNNYTHIHVCVCVSLSLCIQMGASELSLEQAELDI